MEHISRRDIGERLDDVLETIERDDVGFVISDEGERDLLLCPTSWFSITFDDDFGCIVGCAVRYALGRYTYMPQLVAGFVSKYMAVFDTKTLTVMARDIGEALQNSDLPYTETWVGLKHAVETRLKELYENGSHK